MKSFFAVLISAMLLSLPQAGAFQTDEPLDDPALEARARALARDFRCLVCQNQSIFDSDAELAVDLRRIVRERIAAGESDQGVRDFLVARYGDFVLLKPPFKPKTYLLWLGPPILLVLAAAGVAVYFRGLRGRAAGPPAKPLSEAERIRLEALIKDDAET